MDTLRPWGRTGAMFRLRNDRTDQVDRTQILSGLPHGGIEAALPCCSVSWLSPWVWSASSPFGKATERTWSCGTELHFSAFAHRNSPGTWSAWRLCESDAASGYPLPFRFCYRFVMLFLIYPGLCVTSYCRSCHKSGLTSRPSWRCIVSVSVCRSFKAVISLRKSSTSGSTSSSPAFEDVSENALFFGVPASLGN